MPRPDVIVFLLAGLLTVAGLPAAFAQDPVAPERPPAAQPPVPASVPAPAQPPATVPPAQVPPQVALPQQTPGQNATTPAAASERRVKAEFLYKFLGYAEFPATAFADAASPVQIGVAGSDEMLAELVRTVAGRTVQGRAIVIKPVREGDAPGPLHLLFVAGSDCALVVRTLRGVPAALLPVTECDGGLQAGSVINFRMVDEHVRFDVSLDAAEKNNVRLSSRLLNVANHVQKGTI